jgi:hypothetical protein
VGVVTSTGKDAKIVQNLSKSPRKVTMLERHMNVLVTGMFGVLFVVSAFMAVGQQVWEREHPDASDWYLKRWGRAREVAQPGQGWGLAAAAGRHAVFARALHRLAGDDSALTGPATAGAGRRHGRSWARASGRGWCSWCAT